MRGALALVVVLLATAAHGADVAPRASGTLGGKTLMFPEKEVADGAKATVSLLESCRSESVYRAAVLKEAEQGDHVRLVFAAPVTVTVMEEEVEVSELVFRLPLETGVFWARDGGKWRQYSKYQCQKEGPFVAWLRQAQPAN